MVQTPCFREREPPISIPESTNRTMQTTILPARPCSAAREHSWRKPNLRLWLLETGILVERRLQAWITVPPTGLCIHCQVIQPRILSPAGGQSSGYLHGAYKAVER